jgi:hypothetical protein
VAKRRKSSVNKAQSIRDYVTAHPEARGVDVVAGLKSKGVKVSSAQYRTSKRPARKRSEPPSARSVARRSDSPGRKTFDTSASRDYKFSMQLWSCWSMSPSITQNPCSIGYRSGSRDSELASKGWPGLVQHGPRFRSPPRWRSHVRGAKEFQAAPLAREYVPSFAASLRTLPREPRREHGGRALGRQMRIKAGSGLVSPQIQSN